MHDMGATLMVAAAVLLWAAAAAAAASDDDACKVTSMLRIRLDEHWHDGGGAAQMVQLVRDFELVRKHANLESVEGVSVRFDSSRFKRREKEIKDRYAALYQSIARLGHQLQPPATLGYEHVQAADRTLWHELHERKRNAFIATRSDWKQKLTPAGMVLQTAFHEFAGMLSEQHKQLQLEQDQQAQQLDDTQVPPCHADELMELDRAIARMFNSTYLPRLAELHTLFPWLAPSTAEPAFDMQRIPAESVASAKAIPLAAPLDWVFFFSNRYRKLCEVWNREYLAALASYMAHRIKAELSTTAAGSSVNVLEVGAGDGRLTHFLKVRPADVMVSSSAAHPQVEVNARLPPASAQRVTWAATDIVGNTGDAWQALPVEEMSHAEALQHYQPAIVVCSWMTMGLDLTADIRRSSSVQEYILIGEVDFGVSGKFSTWGVALPAGKQPQYELEGFERMELSALSVFQVARSDTPFVQFHSTTTSFRRRKPTRRTQSEL